MRATIKVLLLHTLWVMSLEDSRTLCAGHRALPPAVPTQLQHFSTGAFPREYFRSSLKQVTY